MAFPTVSYSFVNGQTSDATQVNQNFTDLLNALSDGTKDLKNLTYTSVNQSTFAAISTPQASDNASTGTLVDVSTSNVSFIRFTNNTGPSIQGFANGADGKLLIVCYTGSGSLVLQHQNSGETTAANRIISPTGGDLTVPQNTTLLLIYDNTALRWRIFSSTSASTSITYTSITDSGEFFIQDGTDYSTTGSSNNVSTSGTSSFRYTGSADGTITGFGNGANGKVLYIENASGHNLTFTNNDSNSSAANRILTGSGNPSIILPNASALFKYNSTESLWKMIANSSEATGVQSKTGTYQILASDRVVGLGTAAFTATLPAANIFKSGQPLILYKSSADFLSVTISRAGSDTITEQGASGTSTRLDTAGETIILYSDGSSNWIVTSRHTATTPTSYSLTIGGSTSAPTKPNTVINDNASWWRNGKHLYMRYEFRFSSSTGAAAGSGTYLFPLPDTTNLAIDTANAGTTQDSAANTLGTGTFTYGTGTYQTTISYWNTTNIFFMFNDVTSASNTLTTFSSANASLAGNNTVEWSFTAMIPISGWKA